MAQQMTAVRGPPPRMLSTTETYHTLTHWKTAFRTYYRRDDYYKDFLLRTARWDSAAADNGQTAVMRNDVEVRSAADRGGDIEDFLYIICGFLPFPYLTEKIVKGTKKLEDVWDVISDHYGLRVSSESLLDYGTIQQQSGETYRQFYDRLLAHSRLHLPRANIEYDGINTGANGETMTLHLMNHVAMDWLQRIDVRLINIVKTEYSRELRDNTQLCELVPRIANNIEALLSRHDIVGGVEKLAVVDDEDAPVDKVHRVRYGRGGGGSYGRGRGRGDGKGSGYTPGSNFGGGARQKPFCPECQHLAKMLQIDVKFNHFPADCPRSRAVVNMLRAAEADQFGDVEEEQPDADYTGNDNVGLITQNNNSKQMKDEESIPQSSPEFSQDPESCKNSLKYTSVSFFDKILRLQDDMQQKSVRKEYSPQLRTKIGSVNCDVTIDEGSELNCIDAGLAAKCNVKYSSVKLNAMAAGSNVMKILGVVDNGLELNVCDTKTSTVLVLKDVIVVRNLGSNVLIGEPGKMDNNIITFPRQKIIQLTDVHGGVVKLPYHSRRGAPLQQYQAHQVKNRTTLYPGQELDIPVPPSMQCRAINVTMRRDFAISDPIVTNAKRNYVKVKNKTDKIITIPKHSHIADLRSCHLIDAERDLSPDKLRKIYDISREDWSHLTLPPDIPSDGQSYINEISIDPDNQLSPMWKNRFLKLCQAFDSIITPQPGRYNGAFGRVSTDINFASVPPSNLKTYLPRYSNEMLKTLGDKMDTLETWGVLRKPEDLGIVPEFVAPSMLVPKIDGGFRLVTDFTSLNQHIKKLPTISPSIQEAKEKIAKYKYHVFLDLSNYYYQGGVKIEDSQYLATVHPFKGLMVYTTDPQGLLNAGEHAYERLGRIYGDMCADERMTRMADGLYVLGNTLADLFENLKEVFERAKISNLTFKPSKIIICPVDTVIFGWRKQGDAWTPTEHTTLPLINAPLPGTVKQLRSWIGSYKQLSACIRDYSVPLSKLEKFTGSDKSSSLKIQWTEEMKEDFTKAKEMIKTLEKVYTPTPDDKIQTFSDYSQEHNAVGGKLIIVRNVNGKEVKLNGGFFSARLNKFQSKWLPCEGESLGIKLVLEHFAHYIRENNNAVIHFTDSLPCVQAYKRAKKGAFSASARIATFLTSISSLNVEIVHTAGKSLKLVDYISRHPNVCNERKCQICKFSSEQAEIGDSVAKLNSIQIQEILSGKLPLPFLQRQSWIDAQNRDKTHIILKQLIQNSQAPEKKKTKDENTKLKLLFNLYREGKLKVHKDGLVTINNIDQCGNQYQAVSVPTILFPGLIHALHYKLSHPSKLQLTKLAMRHFYTPGYQRIIEEVTDSCEMCTALKQLPKEVFSESTGDIEGFGSNFSADVIERNAQQILIVREKLSSFTFTTFVADQKAETLKSALISLILDLVPQSGCTVQVDCATAWAALQKESLMDNSDLKKLNIKIDLGRHHNKNKNPVVDNACKEFHKEVLRVKPEGSVLTEIERATITSNMNQRIRKSGFSSKEICFKRDLISNNNKEIDDKIIAGDIIEAREKHHPKPIENSEPTEFEIGHNVFLKNDKSKLKARQLYRIVDIYSKGNEPWATIQKHESQFRSKKYEVKLSEIILLPGQTVKPKRKAALKAKELFAKISSVQKKQLLTHGWDFDKLLELMKHDDEDTILIPFEQHEAEQENNDSISSTDSPTNDTTDSEDYEDANDDTASSTLSKSNDSFENQAQNLEQHLHIPEVQDAVNDMIEDLRQFNKQHPVPLCVSMNHCAHARAPLRRSTRNVERPESYATYNRTGKKK